MKRARRAWPATLTKQGSYGSTEPETASMGSAWLCTMSSVYVFWLLDYCSCEIPNRGSGCISETFVCSSDSFILLGSPVKTLHKDFHVVLFCSLWLLFLGDLLFSWVELKEEWIWRKLKVASELKAEMYCIREESIFS